MKNFVLTHVIAQPVALFFLFMMLFSAPVCHAQVQSVGINTTGASPDSSSILDVSSNTKGILIPRMGVAQRNAIHSPATGLMVFDTDCNELQYYDGVKWVSVISSASLATPVANAAGNITQTTFNANWTIVAGATDYYLDVATDAGFTSFLSGYNNLSVSDTTTYNVLGLSCNTTYYYRVRAANSCSNSGTSGTVTVTSSACCVSAPAQAGAITGPAYSCTTNPGTQTYSISSVSGATYYNWTVPSGSTITSGQGTTSVNINFHYCPTKD